MAATILVCINCKGEGGDEAGGDAPKAGARLAEAAAVAVQAQPAIQVLRVNCLANCSRGPSAVIRADAGWSYVFGNISPEADAPALVEGALLLGGAADGLMPWRGRPDCLKRGMIARIPPLDFAGEPA